MYQSSKRDLGPRILWLFANFQFWVCIGTWQENEYCHHTGVKGSTVPEPHQTLVHCTVWTFWANCYYDFFGNCQEQTPPKTKTYADQISSLLYLDGFSSLHFQSCFKIYCILMELVSNIHIVHFLLMAIRQMARFDFKISYNLLT